MKSPTLGRAPILAALIAVLLPAGVLAATTVSTGSAGGARQVGAAGFLQEGIPDAPSRSRSPAPAVVTTTAPAPRAVGAPAVPTTSPTRSGGPAAASTPTTATTVRPAPTTSPTFTIPPGLPPIPTSTIPGGSSWSNQAGEVSARMRMAPAMPVAGQPVTFSVDVTAQDPCCVVVLRFGDSPTYHEFGGGNCNNPPSLTGLSITHTFAAPGAYEAVLTTATFPCQVTTSVPGGPPVFPAIHGVGIHACIVVGPGDAGAGGCTSPAPIIYSVPPPTG